MSGPYRVLVFDRHGDDYEWHVLTIAGWRLDSGRPIDPPARRFGSMARAVAAALTTERPGSAWDDHSRKIEVCEGSRIVASFTVAQAVAFVRSAPIDPVHDVTDFPAGPEPPLDVARDVVAEVEHAMMLTAHQAMTLRSINRFIREGVR